MYIIYSGVMGVRIDGIEDTKISELSIDDLVNESPLVSCACGSYKGEQDGGGPAQEENEGGMGTDIRGLVISRGDVDDLDSRKIVPWRRTARRLASAYRSE